ncbi:MAG: hypothetical protein K0S31_4319 [Sphingobacterium multivorum]|jgi:hypothetical protein|nr:hypothetical protein [Sphingobacterium multivorum]
MNTKVLYGFMISMFLLISSCSQAEESGAQKDPSSIDKVDPLKDKKILIV